MLGGASGHNGRDATAAAKGDRIMTVVGKILVFLNLVFSLVVGAFAVMDYTARTHWVDGFNTLKARYEVLQAVSTTNKNEADRLSKEKNDLYEKLNKSGVQGLEPGNQEEGLTAATRAVALLKDQAKTIATMRAENDDLRKREADAKGKVAKYLAMETAMTSEAGVRQGDSAILRQHLKQETDKNFELTKNLNTMRDDMIQFQIQASTYKSRNSQLEAQLQDVARELLRNRAAGGPNGGIARGGANPPPEGVEGKVLQADTNLVRISLGSDAGLSKGNTLEVFRLGQNPKYIGKIQIVEVTPHYAIGRTSGRMSGPIQVDDRVASRIMGAP
jgi:hypothetical protein